MGVKGSNERLFPKGVSGNPSGRPKDLLGIRDLARSYCPEAITTLKNLMLDPKVSAPARVSAATAILDRGWGRATTMVEVTNVSDIAQLSDTELVAEAMLLRAARIAATRPTEKSTARH